MMFKDAISAIYVGDRSIEPFIGAAYTEPAPTDFRLVVVGINTHISDEDLPEAMPSWFSGWFRRGTHHFFRQAYTDGDRLARALASTAPDHFEHRSDEKAAFYVTNAIKLHMPKEYKRAHRVTTEEYAKYLPHWQRELRAMADHDVFPHLIVLYGVDVWNEHGWKLFQPGKQHHPSLVSAGFEVTDYTAADGNCKTHAARLAIQVNARDYELLLVRLSHPAHQNKRTTHDAEWILRQPSFRLLARLPLP